MSAAASATQPAAALARPDLQRGMTVSGARVRGACVCVCVVRVRARGACARVRVPQAQLGEQQPGVRARLGLRRARARRRQRRRAVGQRALDAVHARRLRADRRWKYTVRIVYSQRATDRDRQARHFASPIPPSLMLLVSSCCESDSASSSAYPLCSVSNSESVLLTSVSNSFPVASAACE